MIFNCILTFSDRFLKFADTLKKNEYVWLSYSANKFGLLNTKMNNGSFNEEIILGNVYILGIKPISKVLLNNNEIDFKYDSFVSVSLKNIIKDIIYIYTYIKLYNNRFRVWPLLAYRWR